MGSEDNEDDEAGEGAASDPASGPASARGAGGDATAGGSPKHKRKVSGSAEATGTGKPSPGKPGAGKPSAGKPGSGKPGSGKPGAGKAGSSTTSTAKSRAAQRKVDLGAGAAASAAAASPATPRKATKPPLYRRGGFWFLVIVAEVLVALLISYRFERTPDNVDLAGGNIPVFCADVAAIRAAGEAVTTIDVAEADATFRRQREAYLKLKASAPEDLQPDLDRLVKSTEELIETTEAIQQRKRETPEYVGGTADLLAVQAAMDARLALPNARLEVAVRNACNIELNAPATSTTTSTTVPAPLPPATTPASPDSTVTVPTAPGGPDPSTTTSAPSV